ncbi:hypothetical protein DL93DRAFT_268964 [Clavulina sp. PMI_390]|nr:hypothetical protein DL93DRAFT_268964 [Clavulina sp. PMI_390]
MSGMRRSTRIHAKASTGVSSQTSLGPNSDHDEHLSNNEMVSQDERRPVQTRKRKALGRPGGIQRMRKKGRLSNILTLMPNEVISEICSYLQALDLLHLVQSSKIFAIFLLAEASAPVWRYARLSVEGLPDCPSDITEQQYACLLFGHYCQGCGKTSCGATVNSLAWQVRRRWCSECRSSVGQGKDDRYVRLESPPRAGDAIIYVPESSLTWVKSRINSTPICKRSQLDAILQRLKELEGDDAAIEALCQSQADLYKQEQRQAFVADSWINARAKERDNELSAIRTERIEDLKNHLEDHGYPQQLERGGILKCPQCVSRSV